MNWQTLITELRATGLTYQQIADAVGHHKGGIHDLHKGKKESVIYETGVKLKTYAAKVSRQVKRHEKNKSPAALTRKPRALTSIKRS